MNEMELLQKANKSIKNYLEKNELGHDEELQLLASAYARLFLTSCIESSNVELSESHKLIARCFEKVNDLKYSERHMSLSLAYEK